MMRRLTSVAKTHNLNPNTAAAVGVRPLSTESGEEEWNDASETAWLLDDLSGKSLPFAGENHQIEEIETETKANDNWEQRKGKSAEKAENPRRPVAKEIEKLDEARLRNFSNDSASFY